MYGKLAVYCHQGEVSLQIIPHATRDYLDVDLLLRVMGKDCEVMLYNENIRLYELDWLVRNMKNSSRMKKNSLAEQIIRIEHGIKQLSGYQYDEKRWKRYVGTANYISNEMLAEQHRMKKNMQGRKLLLDEWIQLMSGERTNVNEQMISLLYYMLLNRDIDVRSSIELEINRNKRQYKCLRCYETDVKKSEYQCVYCHSDCFYCESCLIMGKSRSCAILICGAYSTSVKVKVLEAPLVNQPNQIVKLETYGLSDAQHMATEKALDYVYTSLRTTRSKDSIHQFLLWAVTGAGKTEMIFPLVDYMIKLGGRVMLATPRRDVVLELSPRLQKAFPELSIATLYGGSKEKWNAAQLIIATTHQVMRFQNAFDLVIIDELDAFPYHGDERLYRVTEHSCSPSGIRILLSATPPAYLQQSIKRGKLAHVKLPVRYHRYPLPVPQRIITPSVNDQLRKKVIPKEVIRAIASSLQANAQIFIFLQRIVHTEQYASLLRVYFPNIIIKATSSKDEQRGDKVMQFRERHIRILVTTTILERGVTVPNSHVYICDAEAALFDEASLVQMAGRAGRSKDHPDGSVYYLSSQWNSAQKSSIKQIKSMNRLAKQHGYLKVMKSAGKRK